jgi:uncharacterized protein
MAPDPRSPVSHPCFAPWLVADSKQLERTLVGHDGVVRDFLARLHGVEHGGTASHLLLVGPRGIGKTHVLSLVERYVTGRLGMPAGWTCPSDAWLCAFFTEEEHGGQDSLANFLLSLFAKMAEAQPLEPLWNLPAHFSGEADQIVIDCCFERIQRLWTEKRQRILLIVDNLQRVLEQWSEEEHQRLRSFLSHNNVLVILGSAPSVFRAVIHQKAAFHDFLEIRILSELESDQVLELLARRFEEDGRQTEFVARREELSRKIPAIELLTGGNPRLILFLYEIVARSAVLEIENALRDLLEQVREYFVNRLTELPDQARKVLDTLAQLPGPATPTEIAEAGRLPVALVNGQLKRLKDRHYVRPIKFRRQKSTRYDITDRLFRIWRQTASVAGRQRFRFLADFLKLYYSPEEIRGLYTAHEASLHSGDAPREEIVRLVNELFYIQEASDDGLRRDAFFTRVSNLIDLGELRWAGEEAQSFAAECLKLGDVPGAFTAHMTQMAANWQAGRYEDALEACRKVAEVDKPTADLWTFQAVILLRLEHWEEALSCAEEAVALESTVGACWAVFCAARSLGLRERELSALRKLTELDSQSAIWWRLRASALYPLERWEEALECAEKAVALDGADGLGWAMLAVTALRLGYQDRALEAAQESIKAEKFAALSIPSCVYWGELGAAPCEVRVKVEGPFEAVCLSRAEVESWNAWCWLIQAPILAGLNRWEGALDCAQKAVALDPSQALAWTALGFAAHNLGKHERALDALRKAAEAGAETSEESFRVQAISLVQLGRLQESLSVLETGLARHPHSADLRLYKAMTLAMLGRFEEAFESVESARQNGASTGDYYHVRGKLLLLTGQYADALRELDMALSSEPDNWDTQADRQIALGCVGQQGPLMEALPAGLAQVKIPPQSESSVCNFAYDVALGALRRGENQIGLGLFAATLGMQSWHSSEWFRHQAGSFLRRTLDVSPGMYQDFVNLVAEKVKDENTLRLLDPFLKAGEFLRTGNLILLERLSPEVRELVLDIIRRVEPVRHEELRRLM